jgi:hypothetical protein
MGNRDIYFVAPACSTLKSHTNLQVGQELITSIQLYHSSATCAEEITHFLYDICTSWKVATGVAEVAEVVWLY